MGPTNWTSDYDPDQVSFQLAWVSNASQSDIPIGSSGTFVFESPLDAAPLPYFVAHLAPDGSDLGSIFGDINAPAVPEPASVLLLLAGVFAAILISRHHERAATRSVRSR